MNTSTSSSRSTPQIPLATRRLVLRIAALFTVITFSTTQIGLGSAAIETAQAVNRPVKVVSEAGPISDLSLFKEALSPGETTIDFLSQDSPLTQASDGDDAVNENSSGELAAGSASVQQSADTIGPGENENSGYEYTRYDFDQAMDLMRPEYASAVIVKELSQENLESLMQLSFEVGILVLHGEIVLFTSGSADELGALPAVKSLVGQAALVSHTHPGFYSLEGPSGQDINEACEAPGEEYVITRGGVYAYNNRGISNEGSALSAKAYLAKIAEALAQFREEPDQIQARSDLNEFIAAMDQYNQASNEEKETLRRGGTLSFTTGLTSSSVTSLPGSPRPYITTGSSSATTLAYNSSTNQYSLGYNVSSTNSNSGFTISFDNASTTAVETQNISALGNLTFGLKGPNSAVKLEVVDVNNVKDTFTLTGISSTKEQFWRIPVSSLALTLNKTKIKQLNFIVDKTNTTSTTRTGALMIRTKGLNTSVPSQPVVTGSVPSITNLATLTLSGTKEANTSIIINGVEVVARSASAVWTANVNLTVEGNNTLKITAKNSIGKISATKSITVRKDTTAPAGSININSGAAYAASQSVTLKLSGADAGSGIGKMSFSTDNTTWIAAETYATSKAFTLPAGDGTKTVYVKYFDKAGNASAIYSKTIVLDTLPPTGTVQVNSGSQSIKQTAVTLNLTAADAGSGLNKMSFSSDNKTYSSAEAYAVTKAWTFSSGDGNKTVYVKFMDKSGKWSTPVSVNVLLDTAIPTGSIDINSGAAYVASQSVELNLSADDSGSGIGMMSFSTDNETYSTAEAYATSKTFTLPSGDGSKTVYVKYFDKAGNISKVYSDSILLDTTAPTGSININAGAPYAASQNVSLNLSAGDSTSGIDKMSFSADGVVWTAAENYAISKAFTLSSGDGKKTIYVKYFDKAGNVSTIYSKSIILDMLPPTGTAKVNNGAPYTTQTTVMLNLTAVDTGSGLDKMSFSSDNVTYTTAETYAATKLWTFSASDGNKIVYVKFLDKSGKWSSPVSVTVLLDTVAPSGSLNINSGAATTNKRNVTLNLAATDAGSGIGAMSFSTDNVSWTLSEPFAATKTFTLPEVDGTKTVYVKFSDKAGKVSPVYSKSIVLDMNGPQLELLSATSVTISDYLLRYKVDGVEKCEAWILGRGDNRLMLFGEDGYENQSRIEAKVTLTGSELLVPNLLTVDSDYVFTQTLDSGLLIYYSDGKLSKLEKPGEYIVRAVEIDEEATLTGGYFEFQDGTKSFFKHSKIVFTEDVQGTRTYYKDDGTIDVLVAKDGRQTVFAYRNDASGNLVEILGTTNNAASYYDQNGKLTRIFLNDGTNVFFNSGKINKIRDATGELFHYTASVVAGGILMSRVEYSADFPKLLLYDSDGALVKVTKEDCTEYSFQDGLITKVRQPDGTESTYTYHFNEALLNLISLQRGDVKIDYDAAGELLKIQTMDGILEADDQALKSLSLQDGSVLTDFSLDEKGNILKGTLIDSDGNRLTYENGNLVSSAGSDGTLRKYVDGKMIELTTSDGRKYQYRDTVDEHGNQITQAVLISYEDTEGNLFEFQAGILKQIELKDSSLPSQESVASPVTQNEDGSYNAKTEKAQIRNLVLDNQGKVKSGHFIFEDGKEYFVQDGKIESFVDAQGKRFTYEDVTLVAQTENTAPLSQDEEALRTSLVTQNLDFFKDGVGIHSASGLPVDYVNVQEMANPSGTTSYYSMPVGYTQPTSIGFYIEILVQIALGQITSSAISKADALTRLEKTISSLETIQTNLGWKGLIPFVNLNQGTYIYPQSLVPGQSTQPVYIPFSAYSTEIGFGDNANLSQSLASAVGLLDSGGFTGTELTRANAIVGKLEAIMAKQGEGFQSFYDPATKLFRASYNTGASIYENYIDRLFNEFRGGLAFVVSKYNLDKAAWDNLVSTRRATYDRNGNAVENFAPFDGGAFQMFWPLLHNPELEQPEMEQALFNFLYTQADYALQNKLPGLLSAAYIPNWDYSGKIGLAEASETSQTLRQDVASLYALAAAYAIDPHFVLSWIEDIKNAFPELTGPYGFYDSMDLQGQAGKRYYAIDQASFVLGLSNQGTSGFNAYLDKHNLKTQYDALYQGLKLNLEGTSQGLPSSAFATEAQSFSQFSAEASTSDFISFITQAENAAEGQTHFDYSLTASGALHDVTASSTETGNIQKVINLVSYLEDPAHQGERDLFLRDPLFDILDKPREIGTFFDPGQGSAQATQVLDQERGGLVHKVSCTLAAGIHPLGFYAKFDALNLNNADFLTLTLKRGTVSSYPTRIKIELKGTGESFILDDLPAVWTTYALPLKKPISPLTEISIVVDENVPAAAQSEIYLDDFMVVRVKEDARPDIYSELGMTQIGLKNFIDLNINAVSTKTPFVRDTILLREVSINEEGEIVHAVEEDRDGTIKYFDQGKVTKMITPEGKTVFYEDGYASYALDSQGREARFSYSKDRMGEMIEMVFDEPDAKRYFSPDGTLTKIIHQGITAIIEQSKITSLRTRYETLNQLVLRDDGTIKDADILFEDGCKVLVRNGVLKELDKPNGTKIYYALQPTGEVLVSAIDTVKLGRSDYLYTYDASGKISKIDASYVSGGQTIVKNIVPFLTEENRIEESGILLDSPIVNAFDITGNMGSFWEKGRGWVFEKWTGDSERGMALNVDYQYGTPYYLMGVYVKLPNLDISQYEFANVTLKKDPGTVDPLSISLELKGPGGTSIRLDDISTTWTDYNVNLGERSGSLYELTLLINPSSNPNARNGSFSAENVSFFSMRKMNGTDWVSDLSFTGDKVKSVVTMSIADPFMDPGLVSVEPPEPQDLKNTLDFPVTIDFDKSLNPTGFERGDQAMAMVSDGKVSEVTLKDGTKIDYSSSQGSSSVAASDATTASYSYDKIRSVITPEGNTLTYSYEFDSENQEITVIEDSKTLETRRYRGGKLISITDITGLVTNYTYEGDEFKSSELSYKDRTLGITQYSVQDDRTEITDETGITWFYDTEGNLIAHRTPEGLLYLYKDIVDEQGNPGRMVFLAEKLSADGTHLIYEEGVIREAQTSDGVWFTDLSFDADRKLEGAHVTYEDGTEVIYQNNLPISIAAASGVVRSIETPLQGEVHLETDAEGKLEFLVVKKSDRTLRYNREGELVNMKLADGRFYEYFNSIFTERYTDNYRVLESIPQTVAGVPIPFEVKAEVRKNQNGLIEQGMASVFVSDRLVQESAKGLVLVVLDELTGDFFSSYTADLSKAGQTELLKEYVDQIPNGKYVLAMYLDSETTYGDNFELLTESFSEIGSVKLPEFKSAGTKPWIVFGRKGLLKGQAIETFTTYSEGIRFDSHAKRMFYFNSQGQQIPAYEAFGDGNFPTSLMGVARRSARMADVTETLGTIGENGTLEESSAVYFKNFNVNYPASGFYHFWADSPPANIYTDEDFSKRCFSEILDMLSKYETKAIYYDGRYPFVWMDEWLALKMKGFFAEQGYEVLNADELVVFMEEKGPDAVVIMVQDVFPDTVISPSDTNPLVRQYLDRAGSIVWTGDTPFYYIGHTSDEKHDRPYTDIWGADRNKLGLKTVLGIMPGIEPAWRQPIALSDSLWDSVDPVMQEPRRKLQLDLRELDAWVKLKAKFDGARPSADTEVISVYDSGNKLSRTYKEDGGFSIYDQGVLKATYDKIGREIARYEYDIDGNPIEIKLLQARDQIESQITASKIEVSELKARALLEVAKLKNSYALEINRRAQEQRSALRAERSRLEGERYKEDCDESRFLFWTFRKCRSVEVPGVQDAINELSSMEGKLNEQEAESYASLDAEIRKAKDSIDRDQAEALAQIEEKEKALKLEVLREEIYPVLLHYYRTVLGRDPSSDEISGWLVRSEAAGKLDVPALKSEMLLSDEYATRSQFVSQVKTAVESALMLYVSGTQSDHNNLRDSLGLAEEDLIAFSASDADEILKWLKAKSLHFGQSAFFALRDLLVDRGVNVVMEDLAAKALLIDILTGVIHAHNASGDLILSMYALDQVAALYGVDAASVNMTLTDLEAVLNASGHHKAIAHVSDSHYVVVTAIKDGKVYYDEPNIGEGGASFSVTKEVFLKMWISSDGSGSGNVLVSDSVPATAKVLSKQQAQSIRGGIFGWDDLIWAVVLIVASGAINAVINWDNGLGFVRNFIEGAALAAIVTVATAGIGAVVSSFASSLASFAQGITSTIRNTVQFLGKGFAVIGEGFKAIGEMLLPGITGIAKTIGSGLTNLFGFLKPVGKLIIQGLTKITNFIFTPATSIKIGEISFPAFTTEQLIAKNVVALGASYSVSKGLDRLGVNSTITGLASAFLTGGILGGTTAGGMSLTRSFISAGLVGLASRGVSEIALHLGVAPPLTNLLAIAAGALTGAALDPTVTIPQTLKNLAPTLAKEMVFSGVQSLAVKLGISPVLSEIAAIPINSILTPIFGSSQRTKSLSLFDAIKESLFSAQTLGGLVSVVANIGLDALNLPTSARDFLMGFLNPTVSGCAIEFTNYAGKVFSSLKKGAQEWGYTLKHISGVLFGLRDKVLDGADHFIVDAFKNGIKSIASIFSRETQEEIYADETRLRDATVTAEGSLWRWQSGETVIEYDSQNDILTEDFGVYGSTRIEGLRQDETGNISYDHLIRYDALDSDSMLKHVYEDGRLVNWDFSNGGQTMVSVTNNDFDDTTGYLENGIPSSATIEVFNPIEINFPKESEAQQETYYLPTIIRLKTSKGKIIDAKLEVKNEPSGSTNSSSAPSDKPLYTLVNGFLNESVYDAPSYLYNMKQDIVKQSDKKVTQDDIIIAPTYFASPWLKVLSAAGTFSNVLSGAALKIIKDIIWGDLWDQGMNVAKDLEEFIRETGNIKSGGNIAADIKKALKRYFDKNGDAARAREMVGVGYSGGFLPMAEVFANEPYDPSTKTGYNTKSLVALGAANLNVPEAGRVLAEESSWLMDILQKLDKLVSVSEDVFAYFRKGFEKIVQTIQSINPAIVVDNFVDTIIALLRQGTAMYGQAKAYFTDKVQEAINYLSDPAPFNIANADMNLLVNVYGTKDFINDLGEAGQKIGGNKENIGGFAVDDRNNQLINIEIVGAGHADYVREEDSLAVMSGGVLGVATDWIFSHLPDSERDWNKTVSDFVADLVGHSQSYQKLYDYLTDPLTIQKHSALIIEEGDKWVIKLPGWKSRDGN